MLKNMINEPHLLLSQVNRNHFLLTQAKSNFDSFLLFLSTHFTSKMPLMQKGPGTTKLCVVCVGVCRVLVTGWLTDLLEWAREEG